MQGRKHTDKTGINTYTVLVPRSCQYMQTGYRKKNNKRGMENNSVLTGQWKIQTSSNNDKVGEGGTGQDDRLIAKNVVDTKVIKLQRNVPINWRDT